MYAYHYWKCYHKEGAMFQTASLFSIEVDYYNFGTCEMTGGSYFCGDHSCNTFKYVGERVHGATGKKVFEMPATGANVAKLVADTSPGATPGAKTITTGPYRPIGGRSHGTKDDSPIYTAGTGNTDGNRAPAGYVANDHPGTIHSQFVQTDQHGYPLRADAAEPQYHLYDGTKATEAAVSAASGGMATVDSTIHWHTRETLVAGACKAKCDHDTTCRGFQENRWQMLHTTVKCSTFHFGPWVSETNLVANLTPTEGWDFYAKYTEAKTATWLHAPVNGGYSPTTSAKGDPRFAGYQGRRLEGVY